MARYVAGTDTSTKAAWYIGISGISDGIGTFTRFMLSTDDAGMGLTWDTEDVNYACEEAPVTVMNSVKWEKTGVVERIVSTENTRGYKVSQLLGGLFDKAMMGNSINEEYQAWVLYTDNGGEAGTGYVRQCTIQMSSKTAAAQEKRGYEFDLLPVGDTIKVSVTAETVDDTTNEIEVTTSALEQVSMYSAPKSHGTQSLDD